MKKRRRRKKEKITRRYQQHCGKERSHYSEFVMHPSWTTGVRRNWKGATFQNKPRLIWSHVVIWKIPSTREPNEVSPASYGIKCHWAGHPSLIPECPSGLAVNSVLIPALGSTTELEAGRVIVEVAKKGQSLYMWYYFYVLLNSS